MSRWQIAGSASLILVLAFVGSAALGANGVKTKSATVTIPSGDQPGTVTARCGQGTKAVAGGFKAELEPEGPNPGAGVRMIDSARTGGRRWLAAGFNLGTAAGELQTFAYCRDEKVKHASQTVSVGDDEAGTATAKCPRGTKAMSGAFDADGTAIDTGAIPFITSSRKTGRSKWSVSANGVGPDPIDLTAHVYCREGKALKSRQVTETLGQGETGQLEARCKRSQRVVSGGFVAPDPLGFLAGSVVATSRKVGRRTWNVSALALNPETVTAYGYCEKVG